MRKKGREHIKEMMASLRNFETPKILRRSEKSGNRKIGGRIISGGKKKCELKPAFSIYSLASTNINQSAPNLVKVYITIRSRMSVIMEIIGPELLELSALELENLSYLTLFTL